MRWVVACLLATAWGLQVAGVAPLPATEGRHGMVASASGLASQVGVDVLQRGGNAVDAAVAVGFALAVTYPQAGNLGGGGFMLVRWADGRSVVIDYRETAPLAAGRTMYLDAAGDYVPDSSLVGWRAAGVPGTVAGLALAHERFGVLPWRDVIEPARSLAADGFVVSPRLARSLRANEKLLGAFPESRRLYLRDGEFLDAGERFLQPDLAATLARIQAGGPYEFYTGETARRIVTAMAGQGGMIAAEDLARYAAVERTPLRGRYRDCEILTMPPPSSGGVALLAMLNMLEPFDLRAMGRGSPEAVHLQTEVMRRAFRDRADYLGDPAFADVPVAGLVQREYARKLMEDFDPDRASASRDRPPGNPARGESTETTHFSVVDAAGNIVANTCTLNGAYGCGVTVAGTGVLLNNEMDDFTAKPGVPNLFGLIQGEANAIAPGKRPLSSMTPTIVVRDGRPFLVLGSPGGPTIITTVLQVLLNVVDHGMPVHEAVAAARVHHQWMPDELRVEPDGLEPATIEALTRRGHRVVVATASWGDAAVIMLDPAPGLRLGAHDPRNEDSAAFGY